MSAAWFSVAVAGVALVAAVAAMWVVSRTRFAESRWVETFSEGGARRVVYMGRHQPGSAPPGYYARLLAGTEGDSKPTVGQRKKEAIGGMGPKTFYYLDATQVKDLYLQVSEEIQPRQIETKESRRTEGGIRARLKFVEPRLEKAKILQTKKTYEIEQTAVTMYNAVEKYLFEFGDVSFGVEDFDYDDSAIGDFRSMCMRMKERFNFEIPVDLQNKFVWDKMRGTAIETISSLSKVSGYVAVQGEFKVTSINEEGCVLRREHPCNELLGPEDMRASLEVACDRDSMTSAGASVLASGSSAKITSVGKVVRWDSERSALVINAIAIY